MRVTVKKLYLNKYVSIRDYLVQEAQVKGEDLIVDLEGQLMKIKHKDLINGKKDAKQQFSKFDKKPYYLIDYLWKPKKVKPTNPDQKGLF